MFIYILYIYKYIYIYIYIFVYIYKYNIYPLCYFPDCCREKKEQYSLRSNFPVFEKIAFYVL